MAQITQKWWGIVQAVLFWGIFWGLLLSTLLLLSLRFGLPQLNQYRTLAQDQITRFLGQPLSMGEIRFQWHGWSPEFRVLDLRLLNQPQPDGTQPALLRFDRATVRIDALESLRHLRIIPSGLSVEGAAIQVQREADGSFSIRDLNAAAVDSNPGAADNIAALFGWLYRQPRIELRHIDLWLRDRLREYRPQLLQDLSLSLTNSGPQHRLHANLRWGETTAARIQIAADIEGDVLTSDWNGRIFASGEQIPLQSLLNMLQLDEDQRAVAAGLSFRAWGDWRAGKFQQVSGLATVVSSDAVEADSSHPLIEARVPFRLRRHQHQWQLHCEPLSITVAGTPWKKNRLLAIWNVDDDQNITVEGKLQYLRLNRLEAVIDQWISYVKPTATKLPLSNIRGEIEDIRFRLRFADDQATITLRARFSDLSIITAPDKPQLQQANGRLEINNDITLIDLDTADIEYPALAIHAGKLKLQDLAGSIVSVRHPDSVHLKTPKLGFRIGAIRAHTSAQLLWPRSPSRVASRSPYLRVDLRLQQASYPELRGLIPVANHRSLQQWLDTAVTSVELERARLRLHGRFSDSAADWLEAMEAEFEMRTDHFPYYPGWPGLEQIAVTGTIVNKRLTLVASQAKIGAVRLQQLLVGIDDVTVDEPWLRVTGHAEQRSRDIRALIQKSPLREQPLGFLLNQFPVSGPIRISLGLHIPLGQGQSTAHGNIDLIDNRMRLPRHQQAIKDLNGRIKFLHDGRVTHAQAQDITMRYLDKPYRLNIGSSPDSPDAIRIATTVSLDTDYVIEYIHNLGWRPAAIAKARQALSYLHGSSAWQMTLDVHQGTDDATLATLSMHSDLFGSKLKLPPPFAKTPPQRRPSQINADLTEEGLSRVQIRYADLVHGSFKVAADAGEGMDILRGSIRFGSKATLDSVAARLEPELDSGGGILLGGRLESFDLSQWQDFLLSFLNPSLPQGILPPTQGATAPATLPLVRRLELDVDDLRLLNVAFPHTRIKAHLGEHSRWHIKLDSEKLAATVNVSVAREANAVDAYLDHIQLLGFTFPDTRIKARLNPGSGWRIELDGEKLAGTIAIPADPHQDTLHIDLDHIQLTTADDEPASPDRSTPTATDEPTLSGDEDRLLPTDLPESTVRIQSLWLNTINLGQFRLDTEHQPDGRLSYTLAVDNDAFSIAASGDWQADENTAGTALRAQIRADDLSALLARLDFDNQHTKGGATNIALELGWDGSPIDYSLARLRGNLNLQVKNGRLLQIKRGITARVFGLLMITALPQRLILNLSDLYEKGMRYKTINGHFEIRNDNACTRDLVLRSDIVKIELAGRIGLSTEDYEEIVTITPRVTNSIPLIPIRFFEVIIGADIVDPHFAYRYSVSGDWDGQPSIKSITAATASSSANPEPC